MGGGGRKKCMRNEDEYECQMGPKMYERIHEKYSRKLMF